MKKTAITPTREENFSAWYQAVVDWAKLAENSPVRGCMTIKPWGFSIWEMVQKILDKKFKQTGHENAYFPLLIPLSFLAKEAEHVEGFATECAVVTHHKLEKNQEWKLVPAGKLEEPFVIRPTSETIIWDAYAGWVQSYRDLPILINQWANVMRWEMRTRLFLRTAEFLWQEGHTAHSTSQEAEEETQKMLGVYEDFMKNYLAIPVIPGQKTPEEKFPWAVNTYTVEAIMQDKKALQMGTSHYLGQNFAKSSGIKFQNKEWEQEYAYTTSWWVSTRMIWWLIMTHSDDNGLVLPPKIASKQIVIIPFIKGDNEDMVLDYCYELKKDLEKKDFAWNNIWVIIDNSAAGWGQKFWDNVRKWVPIILKIGQREIENNSLTLVSRDDIDNSINISKQDLLEQIAEKLQEIQDNLYKKALDFRNKNIVEIDNLEDFKAHFQKKNPEFVICYSDSEINEEREELLKELKATARCIPFEFNENNEEKKCIFSWKNTKTKIIYAKAY